MINRTFWVEKVQELLKKRSVLWLRGVRRAGKTMLCKSMPGIEYFDCEMPEIRKMAENESFLKDNAGKLIALDEIHRLSNPAQLLKLASDHYPGTKVIATGSSSLEAMKKFSDTLTGRKYTLHLTPAIWRDTEEFGHVPMKTRLLHGGLPPFLLSPQLDRPAYNEWLDSYWSKDILELFRLEKREAFMKMFELVMSQSGGMFDAVKFGRACEISRHTVKNYISVMEATGVVSVLRPFSGDSGSEIVSMPKIYGFDSGFVAFTRGWDSLRSDDYGVMWEHMVLNEMTAVLQDKRINYWRDTRCHEVDFVISAGRGRAHAVECKWQSSGFDAGNLKIFRGHHPEGLNFIVSHNTEKPYNMILHGMKIRHIGLAHIADELSGV